MAEGDELTGIYTVPHGIYIGHHAQFTTYILFRTLVRVDIISQRYALLQTHSTPQMRLLSCYCYVSLGPPGSNIPPQGATSTSPSMLCAPKKLTRSCIHYYCF
jgi:hypothetical protein